MQEPKALELGGLKTLENIIDELSRAIHERMEVPNPSKKILDEIDELTMKRNRYCRRLSERETNRSLNYRGY
jgi:hypothetical protein